MSKSRPKTWNAVLSRKLESKGTAKKKVAHNVWPPNCHEMRKADLHPAFQNNNDKDDKLK